MENLKLFVGIFLCCVVMHMVNGAYWRDEITSSDLEYVAILKSFKEWQNEHNITYESIGIERQKYLVWLHNLKLIAKINSNNNTFKLCMNKFGDMTKEEFKLQYGSCSHKNILLNNNINTDAYKYAYVNNNIKVPPSIDWRTKGVVTPVKNQGNCGSCWAFSATGAMECNYAIKTGKLYSLSEQELVDCCHIGGSKGCNGGSMTAAMDYTGKQGGLCLENEYPYKAKNGVCNTQCGDIYDEPIYNSTTNRAFVSITKNNESDMLNAVAKGCVSIGIEADQTSFQYYSSGILTGNCGTKIDHGVLIVGYGNQAGQDYWLVKNSWGSQWGEQGFIKICRNCNKNNGAGQCGILLQGSVPIYN